MMLAWRDINHHLGRFLLTCVGLGLLLGVVMAMIGIYSGLVDDAHTHDLIAELKEVGSGIKTDRPKLAEAVALAKSHRAVLLIAKLDRLARSVSVIANLMYGGVDFVACDQPFANRLTLHLLAVVAEHEVAFVDSTGPLPEAGRREEEVAATLLNQLVFLRLLEQTR
ncbi:MAG: recombinase family protein [Rhodospirillaceae bacterium]